MKVHPIKLFWIIRALIYKPFFNSIGKLTYIGKPCFIEGCKGISIGNKTRIFPGIRMEAIGTGKSLSEITVQLNKMFILFQKEILFKSEITRLSLQTFLFPMLIMSIRM